MPTNREPAIASAGAPTVPREVALARLILDAIDGLRFGSVEIVIHDSQVVQIQRTERMRLPPGAARARP